MSFTYKQVIDSFKSPASIDDGLLEFSHCQRLNIKARQLGFQSYVHLRKTLKQLPQDSFASVSLRLMRRICEQKLPTRECRYFEFVPLPKGIGYYSEWIGWDKNGSEVRVPRPLHGMPSVNGLRKAVDFPVYVVESDNEIYAWQNIWKSTAYIPEDLAKRYFARYFNKQHLVEVDLPLERVTGKNRCDDNMTGGDEDGTS